MDSDHELLQQALEALERAERDGYWSNETVASIAALRARLAQPEPEPEPEPKPVAWAIAYDGETPICLYHYRLDAEDERRRVGGTATVLEVYTAPPARQWVDLTDEEVLRVLVAGGFTGLRRLSYESGPYDVDVLTTTAVDLYRAISEALKAKNGGTE